MTQIGSPLIGDVATLMIFQMSHSLEYFGAQVATKVLMLPVSFKVNVVSSFLHKRFVTSFASVWSLSSVKAHVNLHRFLFRELLITKVALVRFQMEMTPYVPAQVLTCAKLLVTNRAIVVGIFAMKA